MRGRSYAYYCKLIVLYFVQTMLFVISWHFCKNEARKVLQIFEIQMYLITTVTNIFCRYKIITFMHVGIISCTRERRNISH